MRSEPVEVIRPQYHESDHEIIAMHTPPKHSVLKPKASVQNSVGAEFVEVTVKSGDILGRIAQANNTTIAAIKRTNNMNTDRLKIGQILKSRNVICH